MNPQTVRKIAASVFAAMLGIGALPAAGEPPPVSHKSWDEVEFSSQEVRHGFHVLFGDGGTIAAMEKIIELADDDTLVIPGHGPLTGKARVRQVADMLSSIRNRVRLLREQGKTVEEAVAAGPTIEWDAEFGAMMMPAQLLVTSIYLTLDGPVAAAPGE